MAPLGQLLWGLCLVCFIAIGKGSTEFISTPWAEEGGPTEPRLYVFTYTTTLGEPECQMFHIATANGYKMNILGVWETLAFGAFRKPHIRDSRLIPFFEALQSLHRSDPSALVLLIDSRDVIMQLEPNVLVERFLAAGPRDVFGAQLLCSPRSDACDHLKSWVPMAAASAVPTLFPDVGFFMGYVDRLYEVWHGCYWKKAMALHEGKPLPAIVVDEGPSFVGSDAAHLFFALTECGLENVPLLDFYQDFSASVHLRESVYSFDRNLSIWTQRKGHSGAAEHLTDTAAASPLVQLQLIYDVPFSLARAPVALHLQGQAKETHWAHFVHPLLRKALRTKGGTLEAFREAEVLLVGYGRVKVGDVVCPAYPGVSSGAGGAPVSDDQWWRRRGSTAGLREDPGLNGGSGGVGSDFWSSLGAVRGGGGVGAAWVEGVEAGGEEEGQGEGRQVQPPGGEFRVVLPP